MATQVSQLQQETLRPKWSFAHRVGFRFIVIYFGLFCVTTQILPSLLPLPDVDVPDPESWWPVSQVVLWTEAHILRVAHPIPFAETGSGDRLFDWSLLVSILMISALATAIWSLLDRRRENYNTVSKWFRLCIRFALAGQMMVYGMAKAIPLQMGYPSLVVLMEPFRNFSPASVLWESIGAAPGYEVFAGCAELLGGILLVFPRTTTLGALVCLIDMTQVFMLNMTYDIPVKLLSFHLMLLSLYLLAPEMRRLKEFFLGDGAVEPAQRPELLMSRRGNRIALAAQILFGAWLLGMNVWGSAKGWDIYGGGRPKSALYGIWNVDELATDGQIRSPLVTDYGRWRRAIFDRTQSMTYQRMDDSFASFGCSIDTKAGTIALTKGGDKNWKANFTFQRPAADQLVLDGTMDGQKVHMRLQRVDRSKFMLVSRGFHWVQDSPFYR